MKALGMKIIMPDKAVIHIVMKDSRIKVIIDKGRIHDDAHRQEYQSVIDWGIEFLEKKEQKLRASQG